MKALKTICGEYQEEDIYNMDETGLFWRRSPSRGLSTQSRRGIKKDESRITVVVCTNCTGTDRLPLGLSVDLNSLVLFVVLILQHLEQFIEQTRSRR
jgi:hypothetical protein